MNSHMRFVDLHCDTIVCQLMRSRGAKRLCSNPEGQVDIERMRKTGALVQAFAIYIDMRRKKSGYTDAVDDNWEFFNVAADLYDREIAANADAIAPMLCCADIEKNAADGRMSALLTVEDGVPLEGKIERVDEMYRRGVRLITFTWNYENSLGYPQWSDAEKGLKPFGIDVLRRMNEIGMIADCSHLSDAGFWDMVKYSEAPFVASHSCARELCDVGRNLTDGMLRALADKGGVIGINFAADFLVKDGKVSHIADIVRHARHIADVAGIGSIALGSDFDGLSCPMEFRDYTGFTEIEDAFLKEFTSREVDMITHENALRVFREVIK